MGLVVCAHQGGTGLNLTVANHVFLLDPWWYVQCSARSFLLLPILDVRLRVYAWTRNPFTELQAIDRVHRLGQTRPVRVTQLVIADSVEEKIIKMQELKKKLATDALSSDKKASLSRLSVTDLHRLFSD